MEFFTYTLANGIRCIFKRIKSPVAYCAMTINAGSRDELPTEHGMAHFAEHSLFKGTVHRRAYHINNRLEKLGGELNAFTTKEETVIHATTLRGDLPKAAELISDVLFNSVFPVKEVEKEREVILDEICSYKDSPPERIYDEFEDMLFAGSPLGHNILGSKSSVSKFTADGIRKFTERCYNTDQMVFSVMASIPEKRFVALAEHFFGGVRFSPRSFERAVPRPDDRFGRAVNRGTHQAHCIIGNRAYDVHHPRRIALSLLVNILGGPAANSVLNTILREKHGLTYTVEASHTPYNDTGMAAIYFGTDKDKVERCMELINGQLDRFKNTPMTTRQLSAAKKQFTGQFAISMEGNEGYMLNAGKSYLVYDTVDSPSVIYDKVMEVTASDIMETANEIFAETSYLLYNGHRN